MRSHVSATWIIVVGSMLELRALIFRAFVYFVSYAKRAIHSLSAIFILFGTIGNGVNVEFYEF